MQKFLLYTAAILFLASCDTEEIGFSKDVNPASIYTSYDVSVQENALVAECIAKFRFAGPNGTTLVLSQPSDVALNGEIIKVDSSTYQGAFYAAVVPLSKPSHEYVFTGIDGIKYSTTFQVSVPVCGQVIINDTTGAMEIRFQNIQEGDSLELSVSDTSKSNANLEEQVLLKNNIYVLPPAEMNSLSNGPLKIEMSIFRSMDLKECPKEGGQMMQRFHFRKRQVEKKSRPVIS